MTKRVLFVCLGNICRSPAGASILRHLAASEQLDVVIESAGTIAAHAGQPSDRRMRSAGAARGYQLDDLARQVTRADLDAFQLVIAMDRENLADLQRLAGGGPSHICLLSDFLDPQQDWPRDVPDPYYGGDEGFDYVLDMLEEACPAILRRLDEA